MSENPSVAVINFRSLGMSLALLLLALLGSAALVFFTEVDARQSTAALQRAISLKNDTAVRLSRANDDAADIQNKIIRYNAIMALGRAAPEHRLEWVETLKGIKESRRLYGLEYEIAPQRRLDEKAAPVAGYDYLVSPMRLELPLLHEDDLLGLIADLSSRVEALVSVRRCHIERLPGTLQPDTPSLKAICDIDWITLQEKS